MMRSLFVPVFSILLLVSACCLSACISPFTPANTTPVNATPTINVGLNPVMNTPDEGYCSLGGASAGLPDTERLSSIPSAERTQVVFIQGGNLDDSGNARVWTFGIRKGNASEIRVFDCSGWTIIAWNTSLSGYQIDLDHVVSPESIFDRAEKAPSNTTTAAQLIQRDLELKYGVYRITITEGGTTQVLRYNASTGETID